MADAIPVATTTTTVTADAAAPVAGTPWYAGVPGVDQEMVGHWTNKGWLAKDPKEIVVEATKAWKEAERFVGAPANELVRIPKEGADEASWNKVWQRFGKPADAKEYDFSTAKYADGRAPEDKFLDAMRQTAFRLNMPKATAAEFTREVVKYMDSVDTSERTEVSAKFETEKTALAKNWGANMEANLFVAKRAAQALGVDPDTVAALEKQVGYAKVMEMFRSIGTKIGEDKFITGSGNTANSVMTREQAVARKADLMKDTLWVQKYMKRDAEAIREMTALNTLIVSGQVSA